MYYTVLEAILLLAKRAPPVNYSNNSSTLQTNFLENSKDSGLQIDTREIENLEAIILVS
jgi:hypothetical protein